MIQPSSLTQSGQQLDPETLGKRLRAARKQHGWTLVQVAERSNVSITTISRAERGLLALGYENFAALASALNIEIATLFSSTGKTERDSGRPILTRAGQGVVYKGSALSYEFLATAGAVKPINPVLATVHARKIHGPEDFARHEGAEFIYVLSGEVQVNFENGEQMNLVRGDSLYFDSRLGHAFISVGRQLARIVGCITNESAHMAKAREQGSDPSPL